MVDPVIICGDEDAMKSLLEHRDGGLSVGNRNADE
jgi:hypothetical protein